MMKKEIYRALSALLLAAMLSACSNEEIFAPETPQPGSGAIELTVSAGDFVTDGAPDTRAADNGNVTTFENGDRIGLIILKDNGANLVANNLPYKYDGTSWAFDAGNAEGKTAPYYDNGIENVTYIAYFPYSKEADGIKTLNALKSKFAPKTDQRSEADYRASDLMVWASGAASLPQKKLTVDLTHACASISLSPEVKCTLVDDNSTVLSYISPRVSDVSFTVGSDIYLPFQAEDGSFRYILPAGTSGSVRWFYTFGGETYGSSRDLGIGATANTRYARQETIDKGSYTLDKVQAGDFYCKGGSGKGYLVPGDAPLTAAQQAACIGIVYSTDANRIGATATQALKDKGVNSPHGLVMALTNASERCMWGEYGKDENSSGGTGEPFNGNTDQLLKQYSNIDGYGETYWIINTYVNSGTTLQDTYSAFYHASRYGTADSNTDKYATPNATTGWFIPSMGQWWDILSNLGGIDLSSYRDKTDGTTSIPGAVSTAVDNMNKYLGKINGAMKFSIGPDFWSSSEYDVSYACRVGFGSNGYLRLSTERKYYSNPMVRCSFAF